MNPNDYLPADEVMERLYDLEDKYHLLDLKVDGWSIWPIIRYSLWYRLNNPPVKRTRPQKVNKKITIMHPGPINRGIELDSDLADDPQFSVILNQVTNGVAVRMAILYLLSGEIEK